MLLNTIKEKTSLYMNDYLDSEIMNKLYHCGTCNRFFKNATKALDHECLENMAVDVVGVVVKDPVLITPDLKLTDYGRSLNLSFETQNKLLKLALH